MDKKSYGRPKERYWTMRSDKPTATKTITSGTPIWTPMSADAITHIFNSTGNIRFKFEHTVINNGAPGAGSWTCNLFIGAYRFYKGSGGASDTFKKWASVQFAWSGLGDLARTARYDSTGAITTASTPASQRNLPDGTYMLMMLWTFTSTKLGSSHVVTAYGANTSLGNWIYRTTGLTAQTSLPATVASIGGSAETFQPLLIWEN